MVNQSYIVLDRFNKVSPLEITVRLMKVPIWLMIMQDYLDLASTLPMMMLSYLIPHLRISTWILLDHPALLVPMMLSWKKILMLRSMACPSYVVLDGWHTVLKKYANNGGGQMVLHSL